jgi:ornithine cyclodeaminase/alanine dehydrogenase-like protein (mu-crystallin family)
LRHFSREEIFALDPRVVADAMADALAMVARGAAVAPVRSHIDLGDGAGTFLISGVLTELDLLTVKVINVRPANAALGMPRLQGGLTAFRSSTGEPLATLDARAVTEVRTAACSAVSFRRMARPDSSVLVIFGSGPQAAAHRRALSTEHDFTEVRVVGRGDDGRVALEHADVVVTATNSVTPLFPAAAIQPGTHLMCVGSGSAGAAEVEPELLARAAAIRVDHRPTCLAESGEIVRALASGLIQESDVSELGEVLLGRAAGRSEAGDITVYKSVGNGTQDAALTALLLGVTARA